MSEVSRIYVNVEPGPKPRPVYKLSGFRHGDVVRIENRWQRYLVMPSENGARIRLVSLDADGKGSLIVADPDGDVHYLFTIMKRDEEALDILYGKPPYKPDPAFTDPPNLDNLEIG